MSLLDQPSLADAISDVRDLDPLLATEYDRQRAAPEFADEYYIHLSDLRIALAGALASRSGSWLDFGSNTCPYRSLLGEATVQQADIKPSPEIDYLIRPGEPCPAPDAAFDGILSTQVLEHVRDVPAYLQDCRRMLRPSGTLVVTTHGVWEDHACPDDYWRWTADGLCLELSRAGFHVEKCLKITTDLRAIIQLAMVRGEHFLFNSRRTTIGMALHVFGRMLLRDRGKLARFADRALSHQRVAEGPGAKTYLGLLAIGRKSG